jgi:aspartyl-tRNA(Asn)/glutamyl-tRNA(Gln) amidotransferase subunit A
MWESAISSARGEYARYLTERDESVGSFLEIGSPTLWGPGDSVDSGDDRPGVPLPIAVKDNIAVKGYHLTCGSRMLENLISPYDATAVRRLREAGASIVGKTNLDEFGMGSSTDNSALKTTSNPWDHSRVAGGSSGGSAAAVAQQLVPVALGSDTGGSIRQPAAFCGVYGLKPTYGTVSRYGLVAYASSLEVVGVLGGEIEHVAKTYRAIRGEDEMDHSTVSIPPEALTPADPKTVRRIGVLHGDLGLDEAVARNYAQTAEALGDLGYEVVPVELNTLEYVVPAYYTIAAAEASANLARFNGVRYGYRPDYSENPEELMRRTRSEGFGDEVKLRILLGTYVLRTGFQDQYYTRAQKIRTLIRRELESRFAEVDLILAPTFPVQAFAHGDAGMTPFQQKVADRFTSTANLTATPALTVPSGNENGLPVGMQLMGPAFSEERLFAVAEHLTGTLPVRYPEQSISFATWNGTSVAGNGSGSGGGDRSTDRGGSDRSDSARGGR